MSKDNKLLAINPTCPHQGCTVERRKNSKIFICPCHNSKFGMDGQVRKKPAIKPLVTYIVKVRGRDVLVKLL
ncbi:Cytochrome b6-f complex alternative Rieske iron sulfur protein PetC3 [Richelia intracellularis HM01]|uniref:QcrA and Rieske domain-containing protein n=1 Tax=Richelia intracellularis TaxID=1164990 RepID=UPI0002B51AE4|nr:Rieske (2Fe-2S) protein [Richelia intracellularis]CCH65876.1 Cytochrome b6-f complex alternative Rieske iron sulfur protein PetC3 [Richelia intracellularis HM01]